MKVVTVYNKYTKVEETYTVPTIADALISAAMIEDGVVGWLTDESRRNYYRALIITNKDGRRLGNWVVEEVE